MIFCNFFLETVEKHWSEVQQNSTTAPTTAPVTVAATTATASTPNVVLDGRDHTYNRRTGPLPVISVAGTRPIASTSTALARIRPSTVSTVSTVQSIPPIESPSAEPTIIKKEKDVDTPPQPATRVEATENLNRVPYHRPKLHAVAKKSVTVRAIGRSPNGVVRLKVPNGQQQQQQQQLRPINRITRIPNSNVTAAPVSVVAANKAPIVHSKLSSANQTQSNAVQQPVKLWNDMMIQTPQEPFKIQVSVKTREVGQGKSNLKFPSEEAQKQKQNPIENDANDGASSLKIGQVFEGVNEDMVELLQMFPSSPSLSPSPSPQPESTPTPPPTSKPAFAIKSVQSASPLLDTLVKEISHDDNGVQTAYLTDESVKLVTIVQSGDKSCADYRCNICLMFNDSNLQYREHMLRRHGFRMICEQCHEAFHHQQTYIKHLTVDSAGVKGVGRTLKCSLSANASRTYICIVEPPIILIRKEKVFAFRCKFCDLAFQTQRNYVQHAQRHAKQFRCKKCPTKPLNIDLMREHLTHHKD